MALLTQAHFGGNIVLTRDSFESGQPFAETMREIDFSSFRYPGGAVTEHQTWANGGLERMFGDPMDPCSNNYVMTLHEAMEQAAMTGKSMTIVVPTFQFYAKEAGTFDDAGFEHYLSALEGAITSGPPVVIDSFEIGNEYWGKGPWGDLTATEYGRIANFEIPRIHAMIERISEDAPNWSQPGIGVQAGSQWRAEQGLGGKWTATGSAGVAGNYFANTKRTSGNGGYCLSAQLPQCLCDRGKTGLGDSPDGGVRAGRRI